MKRALKTTVLVLACAAAMLSAAGEARACSCSATPSPCVAFGAADAVFVGEMLGGTTRHDAGDGTVYESGDLEFKIEEAFAGVRAGRVKAYASEPCGAWFVRGGRYVVYAHRFEKTLFVSGCSRTRPVEKAGADLAFLRGLPRPGAGVRIRGSVFTNVVNVEAARDPAPEDEDEDEDEDEREFRRSPRARPLVGVRVTVRGAGRAHEALTDEAGAFELAGLPAGKYVIRARPPGHYSPGSRDDFVEEVEVNDRGCAEVHFDAPNDGRIAGRVVDDAGGLKPRLSVDLVPAEAFDRLPPHLFERVGEFDLAAEDGTFEFTDVAPGRYYLGVGLRRPPDEDAPYPRTFLPGVTERAQAAIIEVGPGQKLAGLEIHLPRRLAEQEVRGVVVWPDGSPAAEASVFLEEPEHPGICVNGCEDADGRGRFTLRGYVGRTYRVRAWGYREAGGKKTTINSEPVGVTLAGEVPELRLVLTTPEAEGKDKEGGGGGAADAGARPAPGR